MITLVRITATDKGAFGVLLKDGVPFVVTTERTYISPDSANAFMTKIPAGVYPCRRRLFYRGGYETFEIQVPGHLDVLFHRANWARDVDGCVGVGESYHEFSPRFGDDPGIAASAAGFAEFMTLMDGIRTFDLRVVDVVAEVRGH